MEHKLSVEHADLNRWVVLADSQFEMVRDILCRRVQLMLAGKVVHRLVPVVPKLLQLKVAITAHAGECAHAGIHRTFDWIRQRFWWPGYYTDIKRVVVQCTTCQAVAAPKGQSVIEGRIKAKDEFDVFAMDLIKLPLTSTGLTYALVVMDVFTRFAWVTPINTKSADEPADAFNSVVAPVMRPKTLISDNGSEFKNRVFDEMCKAMAIKHKFCIPYHPQSDGMVERFNRSLVAMLKAYGDESGKNWPKYLSKVTAAYNSIVHPATGVSPFEAMFKVTKQSTLFALPQLEKVCEPTEMEQFREWMRQYAAATQEARDHDNNSNRTPKRVFKLGELVWCRDYSVRRQDTGPNKLRREWSGPWVVSSTWGNVALTLTRVGATETRRAHADQVKPFLFTATTPRELRRRIEPSRPSQADQDRVLKRIRRYEAQAGDTDASALLDDHDMDSVDDVEYVVEAIIGHFHTPQGFWFLVKWVDYVEPTWEHESLLEAGKRVTEYFRSVCQTED
jgi:transposase InsO family protein